MNGDRTKAAGPGSPDIEREMARLAARPAPRGLRDRVLGRAGEARKGAVLAPWARALAVACAVAVAAALLIEPFAGRREAVRLAALLDGRRAAPAAGQTAEIAEILAGQTGVAERLARLRFAGAAAARRERGRRVTEAREKMKGWLAYESSEDLI
ncbi:MAG TPA: hypothetical protein P5119_11810 [Candidatus Aminicenantes bacterium]|nr:hypothetical protein [Candidatus Aminicenantes bacterium]HRY66008.1 hypothetical protein [Candidatus Aminicenantes bacterium]HRZ72943.1 hypothetical protein [Candidatus Aminicenantes bacterium]